MVAMVSPSGLLDTLSEPPQDISRRRFTLESPMWGPHPQLPPLTLTALCCIMIVYNLIELKQGGARFYG